MKKAIVIIPTYNESKNVGPVTEQLQAVFKKIDNWKMEILIVDDTSPDKTYEIVQEMQKKQRNLHLVINAKKSGLGGAYLRGMKEAFGSLNADVVFEFDADLSHDPKKIPELLKKIDQGYDLVLGSRYINGGSIPEDWGLHRKFLSRFGNIVIMMVFTNFSIRDWTAGYRAITKEVYQAVYQEMNSERFSGYTFQIGFLHKTIRKGFKVAEVPIHFRDRTEGESKLGTEYMKNTLIYIFKARLGEILANRIFKFVIVGGFGAMVQLVTLQLWRILFPFQLAFFLSVESAIVSNFVWNNLWTFSDRKLKATQLPAKFVQFNVASGGSLLIQQLIALVGQFAIGLYVLFTLPIVGFGVDTGTLFAVAGILIGMFWNFFAYNKFIWKKK